MAEQPEKNVYYRKSTPPTVQDPRYGMYVGSDFLGVQPTEYTTENNERVNRHGWLPLPDAHRPAGQQDDQQAGGPWEPGGEWSYEDPWVNDAGVPMNQHGEELKYGALGFTPDGRSYYGEGFSGFVNKVQSAWEYQAQKREEGTEAWETRQRLEERVGDDNAAETFFKVTIGDSWVKAVGKTLGAGIMGIFDAAEELVERPAFAVGMTLEEVGDMSGMKDYGTLSDLLPDPGDSKLIAGAQRITRENIDPFLQKVDPIRLGYNIYRTLIALPQLKEGEFWKIMGDNYSAGRMGWSIGVNDGEMLAEFRERVADGENPDLVAMDMERPINEFVGRAFFDLFAVYGIIKKGAKLGSQLDDFKNTALRAADDVADVFVKGGKAVEKSNLLNAKTAEMLVESFNKGADEALEVAVKKGSEFGPFKLIPRANRTEYMKEAGIYGMWLASNSKDADEAADLFIAMAQMADHANNPDQAMKAAEFLIGAVDSPEAIFSPAGRQFGAMIRETFKTADGVVDPAKWGRQIAEAARHAEESGELKPLIDYILSKTDNVINKIFPKLDDYIKAADAEGIKVKGYLRTVNAIDRGVAGSVKEGIQTFAGRAYIGTNPGVAIRGGLYDLFQSIVDTDIDIISKTPGQWAEMSVRWLGGEAQALTRSGLSSEVIKDLNTLLEANTSYKDIPSILEAIRGNEKLLGMDTLTLPAARLLEAFEVRSSQRIFGKSVEDAMRRMLRSDRALNNVESLIDAGLDKQVANNLVNRILSNYGDVEKVRLDVLEDISKGQLSLFKHGDWIGDDLKKALDVYPGTYQRVLDVLKGTDGKSLKNVIGELRAERDLIFSKSGADILGAQHAQAVVDALSHFGEESPELLQATEALYGALQDGFEIQHVIDEVADKTLFNVQTKNAWLKAADQLEKQLYNALTNAGNTEGAQYVRDMFMNFRRMGDEFTSATIKNKPMIDKTVGFVNELKQVGKDPKKLTEILGRIGDDLGIHNLPTSPGHAIGRLWEVVLDNQKFNFIEARQGFGREYDDLVKGLLDLGVDPDVLGEITQNSQWVQRALALEEAAQLFDNVITVGDRLIPTVEFMRQSYAANDMRSFVVGLSKHMGVQLTSRVGSRLYDAELLDLMNKWMDISTPVKSFDQINPEQAYEAVLKYRQYLGKTGKMPETLLDLLGTTKGIPEDMFDISRAIDRLRGGDKLSKDTLQQLSKFIAKSAETDDAKAFLDAIQGNNLEEMGKIGQRVLHKAVDDFHNPFQQYSKFVDEFKSGASATQQGKYQVLFRKLHDNPEQAEDLIKEAVESWPKKYQDEFAKFMEQFDIGDVPAAIPPATRATEARHIWENRHIINGAFDSLESMAKENYGKVFDIKNVDKKQFDAIQDYFNGAVGKVSEARLVAQKYGQWKRDFALHDYNMRYGIDQVMSYFFQFHFWPSRTAQKWIMHRVWDHPQLVSAYFDYREMMQNLHKDSPEWWKYSVNTNELLGLDWENPLFLRFEQLIQPIYFMGAGGFTDPKKRVNWWTTTMDEIGKVAPGYFNPLIQYAIAGGLKAMEEEDAAARWAGRLLPATGIVESVLALMGANQNLDPAIGIFSGGLDVYEEKRIATTLATFIKEGKYTEEEIIQAAYMHSGPAWEDAVKDQRKKHGVGNLVSNFLGINTRMRSMEDMEVDQFWQDYGQLMAMSGNMDSNEMRMNFEYLREAYPFMDALLLGRKGGRERSEAYVWNVLARIQPGQTDDISEALGLPYDILGRFYEDKGDTSGWPDTDRERLFTTILDLGVSLDIPDGATRKAWIQASMDYKYVMNQGEEVFGDEIWDMLDMAYAIRDQGLNGDQAFQDYLEENPILEVAMRWKQEQIMANETLSAYYMSHKKLRDYYKGEMYQKLEDRFGNKIWDKWTIYYSYVNTGQSAEAKAYKAANPDLKAYSEYKKELEKIVSANMLRYGETLPDDFPQTQLQEGFEAESVGQQQLETYMNRPEDRSYSLDEWVTMLGPDVVRIALLAWEGIDLGPDMESNVNYYLANEAKAFGMTVEELIKVIAEAKR